MVSAPTQAATRNDELKRALGFWALAAYGIGDILGAGIYALVGQVAAEAGTWSPLSFLIAMIAAGLSGLSYAELVSRFPHSGGESTFCLEAFGSQRFAFWVGWLVFCSSVVSMATITHAFANYTHAMWPVVPKPAAWIIFLTLISLLNFRGIQQSSMANIVFTFAEASGLLIVIVAGTIYLIGSGVPPAVVDQPTTTIGPEVMSAAAIAFFAFIGFEDMVNVSEEVRDPGRVFPKAIITAVLVCGVLYAGVTCIALSIVPTQELGVSEAPLVGVVQRAAPIMPPQIFTLIALTAVANTGLLNCITASRLIYGMAQRELLPEWLTTVHHSTQTPHRAVMSIYLVGLVLVFSGTLTQLAETTSLLLLVVFAAVNAAVLQFHRDDLKGVGFSVPRVLPVLAIFSCVGLGAFVSSDAFLTGLIVSTAGVVLMFVMQRVRSAKQTS